MVDQPVLIADLLEGNSGVLDRGGPALLNLSKVQLVSDKRNSQSVSNIWRKKEKYFLVIGN